MADPVQIQKNLGAAMKEALRLQDRFVAKPVFAKTGRGQLKNLPKKPAKVRIKKRDGYTVGTLDRPINETALKEALNEFP